MTQLVPTPVPTGGAINCRNGRVAVNIEIDFSLGATFNLDMSQIQSQGGIDSVQTLYVDCRNTTAALTIKFGLTNQVIVLPAGVEAYLPVLQGNPPVMQFAIGGGTPVVFVQAMNFFLPPYMWYPSGVPVVDLTLESVISNGGVNVNASPNTVTGPTDGSGTITAGGTVQALFPANAARKRLIISNPSSATEVLQFCYGISTAGRIDLPPGTTWNEAEMSTSGDEIFIVAATTAHAFTAYEW
jgi:hypothetical protein